MRTSNFAIRRLSSNPNAFATSPENVATRKGVALKTLFFAVLTTASAVSTYLLVINSLLNGTFHFGLLIGLLIGSSILSLICGIVANVSIKATPVAGSLYAISQGFLLGFVSLIAELAYPGIAFTALFATIGVFLIICVLYYTGIIKVSIRFKSIMFTVLIGVIFTQLMLFVFSLFIPALTLIFYGSGPFAILFSIIMVIIASLMILVSLSNIDGLINNGLDKRYEWLGAFGLIVTLIWLYMEILRLLIKLRGRR